MSETHSFDGRILSEIACELGEGPTYDAVTDTAYWFDITGKKMHSTVMTTGAAATLDLPFLGSALATIDDSRQLIVSDQGLFIRLTAVGAFKPFLKVEDKPVNRSNDSRVHPSGALWTSTMGRSAEKHSGAIYHVAGTTVTKLFSNITIPNAICFSPDGAIGYFTDTDTNLLMRVALDPKTGLPTGEPETLSDESGEPGGVDGAVCDADGLIWNARWGANAVDVYKPDGTRIARHLVPASQASCPAYVGKDASRMIVTSAYQSMDAAARLADPRAGQTFELGMQVRGRLEPNFVLDG